MSTLYILLERLRRAFSPTHLEPRNGLPEYFAVIEAIPMVCRGQLCWDHLEQQQVVSLRATLDTWRGIISLVIFCTHLMVRACSPSSIYLSEQFCGRNKNSHSAACLSGCVTMYFGQVVCISVHRLELARETGTHLMAIWSSRR